MLIPKRLHIVGTGMRSTRGRYSSTEFRDTDGFQFAIMSNGYVRITHKDESECVVYGPGQWWAEGLPPDDAKKR